jgi:hypothetical protein
MPTFGAAQTSRHPGGRKSVPPCVVYANVLRGYHCHLTSAMTDCITIVSGLPRSGTSLLMQMLAMGGMRILSDSARRADADNPLGYFECERVKHLASDSDWLSQAAGMAVKVISPLITKLPARFEYKVIFLLRAMSEILSSQRQMLASRGEPIAVDDAAMATAFADHLAETLQWISRQPNMQLLPISHRRCIADPDGVSAEIKAFLNRPLDVRRMAATVDPALYRQRSPDGLNGSRGADTPPRGHL